jgi:hypothetical protein
METNQEIKKIEIEQKTLRDLNVARKWAMFLSILGFILLGVIIVVGLIAGTFLSAFATPENKINMPTWIYFSVFLLIALINFFPVFFLFRFSKHTGNAVLNLDNKEIFRAFRNLKMYFIYIGVLIIAFLLFYVVAIIFLGTSMAFLKGLG